MRKILLLCSIAFMVSCSNDTETSSTPPKNQNVENVATTASRPLPPVENPIDAMFHSLVTSPNYELSQGLTTTFVEDLNLTEAVFFQNRGQVLSWVSANLSTTNFASLDHATIRLTEIETVNQQLAIDFSNVYNFIASAEISQVTFYIGKWLNNYQTFGDPCYEGYRNCTTAADNSFMQDVKDEKSLGGSDYSCAEINHKVAMKLCDIKLADCHGKN